MSLPRVIGITGYARHGKDTVAQVLVKELGYERIALADQMKDLLYVLNPILNMAGTRLQEYVDSIGWEKAKNIAEVRRLLQVFGTEVGRQGIGEDVWIETLVNRTKGFYVSDHKIVIPDVRFINEARWIRRIPGGGGEVWKVTRPNFDNSVGVEHASEREVGAISADETFTNDQDAGYLAGQVFQYLQDRMRPPPSRTEKGLPPHGVVVKLG